MIDRKLQVAILWHQHQPYYRIKEEFVLPWLRLHAVKDYYDLLCIHAEFPTLRMTYNIVPSLLLQLKEYTVDGVQDSVERLTHIQASALQVDEKIEILETFFLCNKPTMVEPYQRYKDLYYASLDKDNALKTFTENDWRDIQVWYLLTWLGPISRLVPFIQKLYIKAQQFTETEKRLLLNYHKQIMIVAKSQFQSVAHAGLAELSASPMYHPILPLLIDSQIAVKSNESTQLPTIAYSYKESAQEQIQNGLQYFTQSLSIHPRGMWCSEGSISMDVLELLAENSIEWTATDEEILRKTKQDNFTDTDKYFPHNVVLPNAKHITVFFRDHALSDAIGFEYQHWNAKDAANDFMNKLYTIREKLLQSPTDEIFENAVVSVILDGENCWEYYENNGYSFLRELYKRLSDDALVETVTMSDVLDTRKANEFPPLTNISPGSWIYGNFNIWIGQEEKNAAWDMLSAAHQTFNLRRHLLTENLVESVLHHLHCAQGSDWFWWYGDDHQAESRLVFDKLFRYHISQIYHYCGVEIPVNVGVSIMNSSKSSYVHESGASTMHRAM